MYEGFALCPRTGDAGGPLVVAAVQARAGGRLYLGGRPRCKQLRPSVVLSAIDVELLADVGAVRVPGPPGRPRTRRNAVTITIRGSTRLGL